MIGYLEGTILQFESDGILLLVGSVGYEVLLNPQMVEKLMSREATDKMISLYIYYHQTERQPKPVLIGFESPDDKEFFQTFITVDAIGPMKAVKAMTRPSSDIARAIETKDVSFLTGLSGVGQRTAEKIIATLHGKVKKFMLVTKDENQDKNQDKKEMKTESFAFEMLDIGRQVEDVLVEQLGHSPASAKRMVKEALEANDKISTPEELFDEIFGKN
ncbi:Holliday junction branch migration protein RuvA [Desulfobacula toluolica]|uniref:Holliday junction branch migration complex subunit RuvA n=1 Tax=Desulfobacula toluolica (strain DSM 7467 / Tol2) TaxID=651182 RepID=K0NF07_DESTT|nr:Holliday junction branch migration protein RuvA [Desulfobacula toluolica]CCK79520.1 RuvA: holliday junction ATP-dependent DNA helicase [Desulfobacula toluolica Tol2]